MSDLAINDEVAINISTNPEGGITFDADDTQHGYVQFVMTNEQADELIRLIREAQLKARN